VRRDWNSGTGTGISTAYWRKGRRHRHHNRPGVLADPHMRGFFQPQ